MEVADFTARRLERIAHAFVLLYIHEGQPAAASYARKELPREEDQIALSPYVKAAFNKEGVKLV